MVMVEGMSASWLQRALLVAAVAGAIAGCGGGGQAAGGGDPEAGKTSLGSVDWPYFGRVPERTHYIAEAPDPPFRFGWVFWAHQLIEFPPAIAGDAMFLVNKTGEVYALGTGTGKVRWQRNLGRNVTGPAYSDGRLYVAQFGGGFVALDAKTGEQRWAFHSPSHLESSPLAIGSRVYFGSDGGLLYALDASTGKVAWKRSLGAPIKASPTYHDGVLYVGDYHGRIHAVSATDGRPRWTENTGDGGGFYSSPAVAFGRVYEARDDGTVFALTLDGHPTWRFAASNAIYSSPSVGDIPGAGPMLFVGSYNHQLYALDASTGKKRWSYDVGGQIPGSPTVVGTTVYTSSFDTSKTVGLDAAKGKPVWTWGSAGYEPMVSDGRRVFLIGYQTIWAFDDCAPTGKGSQPAGGSAAGSVPVCKPSADAHLIDVARALRLDRPLSSAAR
jgi:outer membrane protein assembly factor BamB